MDSGRIIWIHDKEASIAWRLVALRIPNIPSEMVEKICFYIRKDVCGTEIDQVFKDCHMTKLVWLWIAKIDPMLKRCVGRDVARKIAKMLKIDLSGNNNLLFNGKPVTLGQHDVSLNWFYLDEDCARISVCRHCLRPLEVGVKRVSQSKFNCVLNCTRHGSDYDYMIITSDMINTFRLEYVLPILIV